MIQGSAVPRVMVKTRNASRPELIARFRERLSRGILTITQARFGLRAADTSRRDEPIRGPSWGSADDSCNELWP
jgi:hypothetical protein